MLELVARRGRLTIPALIIGIAGEKLARDGAVGIGDDRADGRQPVQRGTVKIILLIVSQDRQAGVFLDLPGEGRRDQHAVAVGEGIHVLRLEPCAGDPRRHVARCAERSRHIDTHLLAIERTNAKQQFATKLVLWPLAHHVDQAARNRLAEQDGRRAFDDFDPVVEIGVEAAADISGAAQAQSVDIGVGRGAGGAVIAKAADGQGVTTISHALGIGEDARRVGQGVAQRQDTASPQVLQVDHGDGLRRLHQRRVALGRADRGIDKADARDNDRLAAVGAVRTFRHGVSR